MTEFVADRQIYEKVIRVPVPLAQERLWIATADIKDMYVEKQGRGAASMVPFLQILSELLRRNVEIRLIHAKEPGPAFRKDFDKYPRLWEGLERVLCPARPFQMHHHRRKTRLFRQREPDRRRDGGQRAGRAGISRTAS